MESLGMKIEHLRMLSMFLLLATVRAEWSPCKCNSKDYIIDCSSLSLNVLSLPDSCRGYTRIDLSHNNYDDVPSNLVSDFEFINISYNLLKSFKTVLSVQILDITANKIEHVELGGNIRNLQELYAAKNNLRGGEYVSGNCDTLRQLDVSENRVTSLQSITTYSELTHLNASHNRIQITSDGLQGLTHLKVLDLSNNALQSVSYLPKSVETLILSSNKLKRVDKSYFAELQALKTLDLSGNAITEVDKEAFAGLPALEVLDLSLNGLSLLPALELGAAVRRVSLRGNNISGVVVEAAMSLLGPGEEDRLVDLMGNPLSATDLGLQALVLRMDASGGTVNTSADCACADATRGSAVLTFCVVDQPSATEEGGGCWVDVARETTTTTTTTVSPTTPTTSRRSDVESTMAPNASAELISNRTIPEGTNIDVIAHASHFLSSLGAAQLSFLAFLLSTLIVLIVINCIVGDPVVDERWWEEKLRGDRVVS